MKVNTEYKKRLVHTALVCGKIQGRAMDCKAGMLWFSENWSADAVEADDGAGGDAADTDGEPEYFWVTPPPFWIFSRLRYKLGKNWSS